MRGFTLSITTSLLAVAAAAAFAADPSGHDVVPANSLVIGAKSGEAKAGEAKTEKSAHGAHWTYTDETGPAEWGRLQTDYLTCYTGHAQSPVDLDKADKKPLPALALAYRASPLNVVNNGHTVQLNFEAGSQLEVDGKKFELVQAHFHAPSEHLVQGHRYPAEFHFVHKSSEGKLAVVGVLVDIGTNNPAYQRFLASAPVVKGEERRNPNVSVNPAELLPKGRAYIRYAGSLTTPPCTEGVNWLVLTEPVELSRVQLTGLTKLYAGNVRPVQKRYEREIVAMP